MKVIYPVVAPEAYYDRNAHHVFLSYRNFGLDPHSATMRFTYTVPNGKRAYLGPGLVHFERVEAPATDSWVRATIYIYQMGNDVIWLNLRSRNLTLYKPYFITLPGGIFLNAGNGIRAETEDLSTGGLVQYLLNIVLTEFDA